MCSTRVSQLTDKNDYRMNTGFQNYTETVEKIFYVMTTYGNLYLKDFFAIFL